MLFPHRTTKKQRASSDATRFTWRDADGSIRLGMITGFVNYKGRNMPAGLYVKADSGHYVFVNSVVEWLA